MTTSYSLRTVGADDADACAVLDAFSSSADMARQGDVHDLASAQEYLAWLTKPSRRSTVIVPDDGSDTPVGLVAITVDEENRTGWFFYWMHSAHRGTGAVRRAAATVADRALRPADATGPADAQSGWGLERLELGHRVNNPASGAIARAAGFVHEGTEREKFLVDGERIDVLTYGRLRSDPWPETPYLPWV
jgi:RimJ/RimL family protein N-acetyltransferase